MKTLVKILILLSFSLTGFMRLYGQEEISEQISDESAREAKLDSLLNDLFVDDEDIYSFSGSFNPLKMHYFYYRSSLNTRTLYAGREIGENQINLGNQFYYLNGAGFYLGLSGIWYSQMDPGYRTTVLMAGYSNTVFKWDPLRFRVSYFRFLSHINDPDYIQLYNQGLSTGVTLSSDKLGIRLDGSLSFGDYDPAKYLSADVYGNITIYKKENRRKVRLRPTVSFSYGVDYQEMALDESVFDPYTGMEYTSYYEDVFGLMNVQLELPLFVSYKNFDFQLSYRYNIPRNFVDELEYPNISSLQLSIGYFFNPGK